MNVYDVMLGSDKDVLVAGGDFSIGESTVQHQERLTVDAPGDYKNAPLAGVGAYRFVDDEDAGGLSREITRQFVIDGMTVNQVVVQGADVSVDAGY